MEAIVRQHFVSVMERLLRSAEQGAFRRVCRRGVKKSFNLRGVAQAVFCKAFKIKILDAVWAGVRDSVSGGDSV